MLQDHQINNPRPQNKTFLTEKNQASYAGFAQSCQYYAGTVTEKTCLLPAF